MTEAAASIERHKALLAERLVRYADLRPCTTAFIDTRTPNSAQKENFTIIGPGVAENPDQHVHVEIPHGFNIGGARQPPGCINSQHSHETAEVFVVHTGTWAFLLGPNKEDGQVILGPGDTISIPTRVFRGFENVGDDVGFMFAVLGGDDPGRVTWAPYVFDDAKNYGLILLEDGSLVDTAKGETIPAGKRPMPATTPQEVAAHDRLTADDLAECVVPHRAFADDITNVAFVETPIIGAANKAEEMSAGRMAWAHGFALRHVALGPGAQIDTHLRHEAEVIMIHSGRLTIALPHGEVEIGPGDVFTVPIDMPRAFRNDASAVVEAFVVRGGDQPAPPTFIN